MDLYDQILKCMGKTVDAPEIAALAKALGRKPPQSATPNRDVSLVNQKEGVELSFDYRVIHDRYPMRQDKRVYRTYLSHAWLREKGFRGKLPMGFRWDLTLAEMRSLYGDALNAFGVEWSEVSEIRWTVPIAKDSAAVLLPSYNVNARRARLELALRQEHDYFSYFDAKSADVHVGFFVAWCAKNDLLDPALARRAARDVERLKSGAMTGREFVVAHIDHRAWEGHNNHLWSGDLAAGGREFFYAYLHGRFGKPLWGQPEVRYAKDLQRAFRKGNPGLGKHPPDWSTLPDTQQSYAAIEAVLDERYARWKAKIPERQALVDKLFAEHAPTTKASAPSAPANRTKDKKAAPPARAGKAEDKKVAAAGPSPLFAKLDKVVKTQRKYYYQSLADGVSRAKLDADSRLTAQLRELWAWKNGQPDYEITSFACGGRLLSYEQARKISEKNASKASSGEFPRPGWWHTGWVPFLCIDDHDLVCVDPQGAFGGQAGQIIRYAHKSAKRLILAPSFDQWLEAVLDGFCRLVDPNDEERYFKLLRENVKGFPKIARF